MPDIDLVPVPRYQALQPYQYSIDNLPIEGLATQIFLVNAQVDNNTVDIAESIGSAGSLANRLNQSLEDNGDLKVEAVDAVVHSIAAHTDGDGFVRMTDSERAKLILVQNDATNLAIEVNTISNSLVWPDVSHTLTIAASDTITWRYNGSELFADTAFGIDTLCIRNYDLEPIDLGAGSYKTTNINTAYQDGTLRIFVNGLRLTSSDTISGLTYTEDDPNNGLFSLNTTLSGGDIIRIDFDQPI